MKKIVRISVTTLSLLFGFSLVTGAIAYGISSSENVVYYDAGMTSIVEHSKTAYETNENGQTFGSGKDVIYPEDLPDLISVVGDSGKKGYICSSELIGDAPSSLEEAVKIHEANNSGVYTPKVYNVYESDGKTIIDTFTETHIETLE